jgi:hypothetical protein
MDIVADGPTNSLLVAAQEHDTIFTAIKEGSRSSG